MEDYEAQTCFVFRNCHTNWSLNFLSLGYRVKILGKTDKDIIIKSSRFNPYHSARDCRFRIYIFQNPRTDIDILFRYVCSFLFRQEARRASIWFLFHGHSHRQVDSRLRRRIKAIYLRMVKLLCGLLKGRFCFISSFVAESFRMKGFILPQAIDTRFFSPRKDVVAKKNYRILVNANNLSRSHFDTSLLSAFPVDYYILVGFDNEEWARKGYTVRSTSRPEELLDYIRDSSCYLSVLQHPENWYNLGTLEAMSCGLPILCSQKEYERMPALLDKHCLDAHLTSEFNPRDSSLNRIFVLENHSIHHVKEIISREVVNSLFSVD